MVQIPNLLKYPNLFHTISDAKDGNLSYFFNGQAADKDKVSENRKKFFEKIGIDINKTIGIWVEGEDRVLVADPMQAGISMTDKEHAVRCDALITKQRNLFLFLLIADCLQVILFDPKNKALGIVHVGWRGADLEIVKKTLNRMEEVYRTDPKDLIVGFGPSARKENYIKENPGQINDVRWKDFLEEVGDGKFKVDVSGFCRHQLLDSGVLNSNIYDSGIDTVTDNRFFSHYRQNILPHDKQGRFACVVGLV
ncbi:MAG: Multi-copper polyphenol oxidoreductase, laccase [Candidatus Woesebacteria bacterium GW2011_GWA1_37_8]|uniref:Multi-copper polyphenol oxidoreductase, laccase n=2 Tax=Candidatus Woeseibacteriota TaxID=1752722 RepID=A0A0G0NLG0_9BACT|nr:MAG: Multi-copper polyphenol oxidoreductase, laccase [Microgenomates group bacterium GW2011_GWC1_37_12b]KKQ46120.1 MAG: Multi-copper polyphenol oxidoreductase, laccase [Candidatus Woesebacteria bacterium GW2011_GWA1_37_8]KKQ86729.1 MAG: Multi-copper polyphenol oxidoreductase, laccase [Candidatus Woesebacteria bacterium GW2011_GWB1_38_8b]